MCEQFPQRLEGVRPTDTELQTVVSHHMHAKNQTQVLWKIRRAASALNHRHISPALRWLIFLETRPENVIQHFCFHFIVQNKITWYMALPTEIRDIRTLITQKQKGDVSST